MNRPTWGLTSTANPSAAPAAMRVHKRSFSAQSPSRYIAASSRVISSTTACSSPSK